MLPQWTLEAFVKVNQGTGNAVLDGARLTGHSATDHPDLNIILASGIGYHESLLNHAPMVNQWEKLLVGLAVYDDIARAGE
jgi:hypothetical protein